MRKAKFAIAVAAALVVASASFASVVVKMDVGEMTRASHAVVVGQVLDQRSEWNPKREFIWTFTRVRVDEAGKGGHAPGQVITVREIGGSVGDYNQAMIGGATFRTGEKVILFLQRAKDGTPGVYQTVALSHSKYFDSTDAATGARIVVPGGHDLAYAGATPTMFDNGPVDFDSFWHEVRRNAGDK
jgi:hypothetical protein